VTKKSSEAAEILPAEVSVSLVGQSEDVVQWLRPWYAVQYFNGCHQYIIII